MTSEGKDEPMPLTHAFKQTVQARAKRDARFREALLTESIETLLTGDIATGQAPLRHYINATIGFGPLARAIGPEQKSLVRALRQPDRQEPVRGHRPPAGGSRC
jgi:hypothetical protein